MAVASDTTQSLQSARNSVAVEITPLGGAAATSVGTSSPWTRRRGVARGTGTVSSLRTRDVPGGDSESFMSSSSSLSASVDTVGISVPVDRDEIRHISIRGRSSFEAASTFCLPHDEADKPLQKSNENVSGGDYTAKNVAWNNLSDDATEANLVIDTASWPALSKSTRASTKSSSSDSLRTLSDGPVSAAQGTGIASPSSHNPNSAPNHASYSPQRSMWHGGHNLTINVIANGDLSELPSPLGVGGDVASNGSETTGNSANDSSSRENTRRDGGQRGGLGSLSNSGNEHQQQGNSFRRGNGGHPRGNGFRHHGYGSKRGDQGRGNPGWNVNRNFPGRDSIIQSQRFSVGPFFRGPPFPTSGPFIFPNMPGRPFGGPFIYPDVPSPIYSPPVPHMDLYRGFHPIHPMAPMLYTFPDPQLNAKIVSQIDYYFSNENLVKDTFLRKNMDSQGWVSIELIAGFRKVMQLTDNIHLILDALRGSVVVEVEGEKVRRRNDWLRWLIPSSVSCSALSRSGSGSGSS